MHDVVVVGAGPAGWAAAAACAEAGLDTALVAPDLEEPWAATYAAWRHEVAGVGLPDRVWRAGWDEVVVHGARRHVLARGYGVFANDVLQQWLWDRAADAGAAEAVAGATGVEHTSRSTRVLVGTGAIEGRVVLDATGAVARLLDQRPRTGAAQVAHGVVAQARVPPEVGSCVLMDWRAAGGPDGPPSFLYALDLGADGWLLEETSLAADPPVDRTLLAARLDARLAGLGVAVEQVHHEEHVHIPMGAPPPRVQRVVGIGAAGGLVHPATGYSVAASLRSAPALARAIADAIARRATPEAVAAAGWQALWPAGRRRSRALEGYGLGALLRFGQEDAQAFFDAFFDLDPEAWSGYLAGTLPPAEVASVMGRLFAAVPWGVRRRLAAGDPRELGRGLRR